MTNDTRFKQTGNLVYLLDLLCKICVDFPAIHADCANFRITDQVATVPLTLLTIIATTCEKRTFRTRKLCQKARRTCGSPISSSRLQIPHLNCLWLVGAKNLEKPGGSAVCGNPRHIFPCIWFFLISSGEFPSPPPPPTILF